MYVGRTWWGIGKLERVYGGLVLFLCMYVCIYVPSSVIVFGNGVGGGRPGSTPKR